MNSEALIRDFISKIRLSRARFLIPAYVLRFCRRRARCHRFGPKRRKKDGRTFDFALFGRLLPDICFGLVVVLASQLVRCYPREFPPVVNEAVVLLNPSVYLYSFQRDFVEGVIVERVVVAYPRLLQRRRDVVAQQGVIEVYWSEIKTAAS